MTTESVKPQPKRFDLEAIDASLKTVDKHCMLDVMTNCIEDGSAARKNSNSTSNRSNTGTSSTYNDVIIL